MDVDKHKLFARFVAVKIYSAYRKTSVKVEKSGGKAFVHGKRPSHGLVYFIARQSHYTRIRLAVRVGKRIKQIRGMKIFGIDVCRRSKSRREFFKLIDSSCARGFNVRFLQKEKIGIYFFCRADCPVRVFYYRFLVLGFGARARNGSAVLHRAAVHEKRKVGRVRTESDVIRHDAEAGFVNLSGGVVVFDLKREVIFDTAVL